MSVRQLGWRALYEVLGARVRRPKWAFMVDLPFPDGSFDVVVNIESSHCYPSVEAFLREVHRVLRPGGSLLLADLPGREEMAELWDTLRESPLDVGELRDITANVCAALELDDDRRRALLDAWIPRPFHRPFELFAAVEGSSTHARFRTGENRYTSARLVRAAPARAWTTTALA